MKNEIYVHPALGGTSTSRSLDGIVSSVTYSSKHLQIISVASIDEKNIVFVPRKHFVADLIEGLCLRIDGEDRHKDYYGDIFIATSLHNRKPFVELFFLFSIYNFHLLNRIVLKQIIVDNRDAFVVAVEQNNIKYFTGQFGLSSYIAIKFIEFSQDNLSWRNAYETV